VVSGVIINSNNGNLIERFTRYLSTQSGYPLQAMYVNKYAELSRVLRDDPKAVGWTCGAPFVEDYDTTGQQLVAVPLFNKKPPLLYWTWTITLKVKSYYPNFILMVL